MEGRRFTIFALFYFVFEGKFQVQAPPRGGWGLYLEGRFSRGLLGSLYLEGVIHGGAYFRNFMVIEKKNFVATHPLSGSKAISLGSSSPKDSTVCWLLPDRSDLDIVSCVVSVQYNSDVVHWTANPSQTPILVIIVVILEPSIPERLMFCSDTSLQKIYPMLKWTSSATALVNPVTTECTADVL